MGKAPVTQSPPAVDFEADYNNRQRVPGHSDILKKWREDSLRVVDARRPDTYEYGPGERQRLEWFSAGEDKPTAVFIHGGYWQALDRGWFSWVAPALQDQGINVAIVGYDLTPNVRLGQSIDGVRRATELVRKKIGKRPMVFGHSAGGHMAACMLSEGRARAALSLSGVFDLEPLIQTSLNEALNLDPVTAKALSPLYWPAPNGGAPGGRILDCWVGGAESNEFLRQSRNMAATWGGLGADTRVEVVEGANHFTILEPLADPDSALVQRLVALARLD
jgi:arylformamidase